MLSIDFENIIVGKVVKKICNLPNILFFLQRKVMPTFPVFILLILLLWPDYARAQEQDWWNLKLRSVQEEYVAPSALKAENGLLMLFMDPDCPVTQKYGATVREIYHEHKSQGINVAAIYPVVGAEIAKIGKFAEDYQYPFPHLLDPKLQLTKAIGATITPEVFLLDAEGNILYQGAIDNWFYELGRYRRVITQHYLKDALQAHLRGKPVSTAQTEAVGCMIGTSMLNHSEHH